MKNISSQKERILQYLENKGISKNKFYVETGISNGVLDKSSGLTVETLEKFVSKFPDANLTWLVTGVGPMLVTDIVRDFGVNEVAYVSEPGFTYQPSSDDGFSDDNEETFVNASGNKFTIKTNGTIKVEVPLMSEPAYASHAQQYFDNPAETSKELPKTTFDVDKLGLGNYMAFVIKNDSMWNEGEYDTKPGTKLLCREVGRHLWPNFHKTNYGFILMTSEGIYHKDIKNYDKASGMLTLGSRNPEHKDFEISINKVNKVFSVIKQGEVEKKAALPTGSEEVKRQDDAEEMYPQRYVNVLEKTMSDKDEIIDLLKGNNEMLKENNEMLMEKLTKMEAALKKANIIID